MGFRTFATDAKSSKFMPSRAAELEFQRSLKKVARVSGAIVESHVDGDTIKNSAEMQKALKQYSEAITPWAINQSKKLIQNTMKRLNSEKAYKEHAKKMGKLISKELQETEVGLMAMSLMEEQVALIKSLPLEAGQRAQELALHGATQGKRSDEIAKELMATTEVTENRAKLIARTETARSNTALNLARATSVGSTEYKWITAHDADVRAAHKKMSNKIFSWDNPPTLEDGTTGHPGTFPNCRCYAEPILPNE